MEQGGSVSVDTWRDWWNRAPLEVGPRDFQRQVLRTVGGEPVGPDDDRRVAETVAATLGLEPDDLLLDLCCGNGLITARLAPLCRRVVALDYSQPLIDVARAEFAADTITYGCAAAEEVTAAMLGGEPVDAVSMVSALQFFDGDRLGAALDAVLPLGSPRLRILLTDVPDLRRIGDFYDTPDKRAARERRLSEGTEQLLHWWDPAELMAIAASHGLESRVLAQPDDLADAWFRYDILMARPAIVSDGPRSAAG